MTLLENDAGSQPQTVIRTEGAAKRFGSGVALQGISFTARRGECLGILGPNGSGKSTLLRIVSGVETPSAGTVEIEGRPIAAYGRKELARKLAVLQQDALPPVGFTVREVVEMGRYPYQSWLGDDEPGAAELVDAIMERLGLQPIADRAVDKLSGGEKQRVALAKVMAQQPQLLLLDEPTTFLDIGHQVQMMDYIKSWQREAGLTVVAVLHDINLAAQYCDRLLVLRQGKAVAEGTPEQLVRSELIADVYGTEPIVLAHPVNGAPQILLRTGVNEQQERAKG
ncbi:ABC transporter ATP-binding protein [Gordoniibacillus kamchatkensis]|uniref:ABC transporter ATP-binding protein n=1 Tax=Gordoniibacillus kamchatkensis TaxID=1590651 RepID=UPI0006980223|nr:ABC transporter ATP-binding protein [Paenibacillus sp. VKM B-2647]